MAMAWPYPMPYGDPNFTVAALAAIAAVNSSALPSPYHPGVGMPPGALAGGYPGLAAYYGTRYSPYGGSAPTSNAASLSRPHLQTPSYHHPHLLQSHHDLSPLHVAGLGVSNVGNTPYMSPPISANNNPTYRSNLMPQMSSPVHSDTSSDCECTGSIHQHNSCHIINSQGKTSPPLKPVAIPSLPTQIQTVHISYETKSMANYGIGLSTSPTLPKNTKVEPPKLFQPYKNDITETA